MEVQETNTDLSDFRVPKMYVKGEWREFPDYRINRDGSKVYNLQKNQFITVSSNSHRHSFVKIRDRCNKWGSYVISKLVWFTFEYEKLDLSECKSLYYKYKYYPRYLINDSGTIIFDTYRGELVSLQKYRKSKLKNSKATYYFRVHLNLDGIIIQPDVQQLVKWTYNGGPETELKPPIIRPSVDHIDRNGLNNNIDNLRWVENSLNVSMGVSGSRNGRASITEDIARQICIELKQASSLVSRLDIADEFNVSFDIVDTIYRGRTWRGISMKYMPFPERAKTMKKKVGN